MQCTAHVDHAAVPTAWGAHVLTVDPVWKPGEGTSVASDCGGEQATTGGRVDREEFAAELARRRADAGLSLADLASRAHLHRGYAGNIEHGKRWPTETVA
ncbi:MAG: helix-turn-helix domain-containing protein, partial [Pseudonocardiaceae bacterium]